MLAPIWFLFWCSQGTSSQCAAEEAVAEFSGLLDTAGAEALTNAALRVIGKVERVVAPEGAVIVPEVVVWIVRKDADGWFFKCVHGVSPFGFLTRNLGQQKTAGLYQDRRSMKSEENFLFGLVTRTSLGVSAIANHRGFLRSRLAP
jgi:hypothetical protein